MYIWLGFLILLLSLDLSLSDSTVKHFAVDLDYTFYINDNAKFNKNIESFKKLIDNNVMAFFCTGRTYKSAMAAIGDDFKQKTGYNGYPGIYADGAVVYDENGNIISQNHFTEDFLKKFVEYLVQNGSDDIAVFNEGDIFYKLKELRSAFSTHVKNKNIDDIREVSSDDLVKKKIVIIVTNESMDIPELKDEYRLRASLSNGTQYITPKDVTKEKGLEKLLEHLNVKFDECAFIGDGDSDVELMKMCKLTYAVGNANNKVKQHAKKVLIKNYDEGAFVDAVNDFLNPPSDGSTVDLGVAC